MYNLFNTPTQNELRLHPSLRQILGWMNSLWKVSAEGSGVNGVGDKIETTSLEPLIYADGFRLREPNSEFLGLGPHIDAGGLARWGSPSYRTVYDEIFSGHPERFDPYDLDTRKEADQAYYGGKHPSTVLRSFQGWTALSRNAPREGSILLYPFVGPVISYVLLRPFFSPPKEADKMLEATAWQFNPESTWFPGTSKEMGQLLSPPSHPHLRLEECLLRVPALQAGDTIWWHSDVRFILLTSGV